MLNSYGIANKKSGQVFKLNLPNQKLLFQTRKPGLMSRKYVRKLLIVKSKKHFTKLNVFAFNLLLDEKLNFENRFR